MDIYTYDWPGGLRSIAGGTRTQIKLDRPWQLPITATTNCVFCPPRDKVTVLEDRGNWLVLQNTLTPYPFHRLVIPNRCWSDTDLRALGGKEGLDLAFSLIEGQLSLYSNPLLVTVHIGALAGQNISHLHWHVVDYFVEPAVDNTDQWRNTFVARPQILFHQTNQLFMAIAGVRAGQCQIVPTDKSVNLSAKNLTPHLSFLVDLFAAKFRSSSGLSPDFNLSLRFDQGNFIQGIFTPILNHWGGSEQIALYTPGVAITLPWPHETTVAHLLV